MSSLLLLLDECIDYRLKTMLCEAGFDTVHCLDLCPGAKDRAVAELALLHGRVLITHDKAFSHARNCDSARCFGLLRIQPAMPESMFVVCTKAIERYAQELLHGNLVISKGKQLRMIRRK